MGLVYLHAAVEVVLLILVRHLLQPCTARESSHLQEEPSNLTLQYASDPRHILLVSNLPEDKFDQQVVTDHFQKFGTVKSVELNPEEKTALVY